MTGLRWHDLGPPEELKFTPGAAVRLEGRFVAIFRVDGDYLAMDNPCPHAGAPLSDGTVMDGKVVCFLHCWVFDLRTGACDMGPEWNVPIHPIRVVDGRLEVALPTTGIPDSHR